MAARHIAGPPSSRRGTQQSPVIPQENQTLADAPLPLTWNCRHNLSSSDYACSSKLGGAVRLPGFGFLVESPGFVAFHAWSWAGQQYAAPPLFVLSSLDDRPLSSSRKVRVFHGFGDDKLHLGAGTVSVTREAILDPKATAKN